MIMMDEETGTYWSHVTGEAIQGPLEGTKLARIPVVHTTWKAWRERHPETTVLKKSKEILGSEYAAYFEDEESTGLFRSRKVVKKMPAKALVHGLTLGLHALAVPDGLLELGGFAETRLGEEPVVIARGLDGGLRAFRSRASGTRLQFAKDYRTGAIRDLKTNSHWDLERGVAIAGALEGQQLEEIPVTLAFWFAWSSFYPNTEVLGVRADPS
jgi:hypothetical protein